MDSFRFWQRISKEGRSGVLVGFVVIAGLVVLVSGVLNVYVALGTHRLLTNGHSASAQDARRAVTQTAELKAQVTELTRLTRDIEGLIRSGHTTMQRQNHQAVVAARDGEKIIARIEHLIEVNRFLECSFLRSSGAMTSGTAAVCG